MMNNAWFTSYTHLEALLPDAENSNHCPILIKLFPISECGCIPFKYFHIWALDPLFEEIAMPRNPY